jgi:hypothetical protein
VAEAPSGTSGRYQVTGSAEAERVQTDPGRLITPISPYNRGDRQRLDWTEVAGQERYVPTASGGAAVQSPPSSGATEEVG